jgi:hypothetical protein
MKLGSMLFAVLCIGLLAPVAALAQGSNRDHFELGAFADYVRLTNADNANYWGVGGRVGFGVASHVNVEAEMAYDFEKSVFNVISGNNVSGGTVTLSQVNGLRLWHGEFGPMLWVGPKHARLFVEAKGGFLNFSVSRVSALTGFTNVVSTFSDGNTNGVFYPGGGAEVSLGPLGIRVDVGDLMYFDNGAHHNLSVKVGPTIRF